VAEGARKGDAVRLAGTRLDHGGSSSSGIRAED